MKIDAVDPPAAADNPPASPDHNGKVYATQQPPEPRQIVTMGWHVDACALLPQLDSIDRGSLRARSSLAASCYYYFFQVMRLNPRKSS